MTNPLAGKPLRYLIALDQGFGDLVEVGYDAERPSGETPAKYCNLRDEYDSGDYGPYLPPDDIDAEYGEPAPDPDSDGFWANLATQLDRAKRQGFKYVELDNLDTYDVSTALECFDKCHERGLDVFVKNPLMVPARVYAVMLLRHKAAVLVIVEEDCGTPATMQAMRDRAGVPNMPIRFVSYGSNDSWAQECAREIAEQKYVDMGVTHSPTGEYASSQDIVVPTLPPTSSPSPDTPTVEITSSGDVRVIVNGKPVG